MIGNVINTDLQQGPNKPIGSAITLLLTAFLLAVMVYYMRTLRAEEREVARANR
jgi:ABC-type spermidine/putrescine transport system permease subunit I